MGMVCSRDGLCGRYPIIVRYADPRGIAGVLHIFRGGYPIS